MLFRLCCRKWCLSAVAVLLWLLALEVAVFISPTISLADKPARKARANAAAEIASAPGQAPVSAAPAPAQLDVEEISRRFYRGVNEAIAGNGILSGSEFVAVRDQLAALGYNGSSEFSRRLVEAGVTRYEAGDKDAASSLFQSAILLAPNSPQILLAAASYPSVMGFSRSLELLSSGLFALLHDPTACARLFVNFCLILLVAMTLALALMFVIQITRNGDTLLVALGRRLPIRVRGYLAPLLLAILTTLPLKLGIVGAIGCWSLLLAFLLPRRRRLAVSAGLIILSWGLSLEYLAGASLNLGSSTGVVVANQAAGLFAPGDEQSFGAMLPELSKRYLGALLGGQSELRSGRPEHAEQYFISARDRAHSPNERLAALIGLGAAMYQQNRFAEARTIWQVGETLQIESYELNYNLANASMALLDVEAHRRYLKNAAAIDYSRAFAAEQLETDRRPAVTMSAPWWSVFKEMIQPLGENARTESVVVAADRQALLGTMLPIRRSGAVAIFGALIFLCGLFFKRPPEIPRHGRATGDGEKPSKIWAAFPAGRELAGERPLVGTAVLALILALGLAYVEVPIHLFSIRAGGLAHFSPFAWAAIAVWAISALVGFVEKSVEPASAEVWE